MKVNQLLTPKIPTQIPALYFLLLFRKREMLKKPVEEQEADQVAHLKFLAGSYKPEFWYMEVFECFRRLYSSAALVFVTPGSATQAVVAFVVVTNECGKSYRTVTIPSTKHCFLSPQTEIRYTIPSHLVSKRQFRTQRCYLQPFFESKHTPLRLLLAQLTIVVYFSCRQFQKPVANVLAPVGEG